VRGKIAKDQRKQMAQDRQEAHDKLTIEQKIDKLDIMFGKGLGAKKERGKLQTKLESRKQKEKNSKKPQKEKEEEIK